MIYKNTAHIECIQFDAFGQGNTWEPSPLSKYTCIHHPQKFPCVPLLGVCVCVKNT